MWIAQYDFTADISLLVISFSYSNIFPFFFWIQLNSGSIWYTQHWYYHLEIVMQLISISQYCIYQVVFMMLRLFHQGFYWTELNFFCLILKMIALSNCLLLQYHDFHFEICYTIDWIGTSLIALTAFNETHQLIELFISVIEVLGMTSCCYSIYFLIVNDSYDQKTYKHNACYFNHFLH